MDDDDAAAILVATFLLSISGVHFIPNLPGARFVSMSLV